LLFCRLEFNAGSAKDGFLQGKREPFALQLIAFYKINNRVLRAKRYTFCLFFASLKRIEK